MGNCLVTKLKGVVQNDNLVKLDELVFHALGDPAQRGGRLKISYVDGVSRTVTLVGGTFTNGTTAVSGSSIDTNLTYNGDNRDVKVHIPDKSQLYYLQLESGTFDYPDFFYMPNLHEIRFDSVEDITTEKLKKLIDTCPNLVVSKVGCHWSLGLAPVDVAAFAEGQNLEAIVDESIYSGDVSTLPAKVLEFHGVGNLQWLGTRPSTSMIMSMPNTGGYPCNFGDYLDAMLINQANCTSWPDGVKVIRVNGNRTAASDAAVATLKQLGWTIIVNGVEL